MMRPQSLSTLMMVWQSVHDCDRDVKSLHNFSISRSKSPSMFV